MQEFFINKDSVNPVLEMELIDDGKYEFHKSLLNYALQGSEVTFSMSDTSTGLLKISKAKANIVLANTNSCEEKYILQYKWKPRDVNKKGMFNGYFDIKFNDNLSVEDFDLPTGNLRVPIENNLLIVIK